MAAETNLKRISFLPAMRSIYAPDFHLEATLTSGQIFRYEHKDGWWYIENGEHLFRVCLEEGRLVFDGDADKTFIARFFSLRHDADAARAALSRDDPACKAIEYHHGLRVIRQDPWECIVSFLCSSASNIPKITRNVSYLARRYGTRRELDGYAGYTFAPLGSLSDMHALKKAGTGFRARYIRDANAMVDQKMFCTIDRKGYDDAKEILLEVPGIGEKIADCILLFGFGKTEAFPVDVWMQRALSRMYFGGRIQSPKTLSAFGRERFGEHAGYIQQCIYHAERTRAKKT